MSLISLADYEPDPRPFLIEGLLGPDITALVGKPKAGKSAFAGHMALALGSGEASFLGRPITQPGRTVYWAGSDSGWRREVNDRWGGLRGAQRIRIEPEGEEPRFWKPEQWDQKGEQLSADGVSVAVLDHLYGFSAGRNLNHSHEVQSLFDGIRNWADDYGIAVLVLAHAGKNFFGSNSAAHSYAIEAECRHILSISGDGRAKKRTLYVSGNQVAAAEYDLRISPTECALLGGGQQKRERSSPLLDRASRLMFEAPAEARTSQAAAGQWLAQVGEAGNPNSGRTMVVNMVRGELIATGHGNSLQPGPKMQASAGVH